MSTAPSVRVVCCFAITLLAGCGEHANPVAPPAPTLPVVLPSPGGATASANPGGDYPVLHRAVPLDSAVVATATIGSDGGVIALPRTGLYVYFPEGAVQKRTTFTVVAKPGSFVSYNLAPHTVFKVPVALVQDLSFTEASGNPLVASQLQGGFLANGDNDIDAAGGGRFAETFSAFVIEKTPGGVPAYAGFYTSHFSGYAYASGRTSANPDL